MPFSSLLPGCCAGVLTWIKNASERAFKAVMSQRGTMMTAMETFRFRRSPVTRRRCRDHRQVSPGVPNRRTRHTPTVGVIASIFELFGYGAIGKRLLLGVGAAGLAIAGIPVPASSKGEGTIIVPICTPGGPPQIFLMSTNDTPDPPPEHRAAPCHGPCLSPRWKLPL